MGVAQGMHAGQLPVRRPAIMDQYAKQFRQNGLRGDRLHAALGMHAIPGVAVVGGHMQPVQFPLDAQSGLSACTDGAARRLSAMVPAVGCRATLASSTEVRSVAGEMAMLNRSLISCVARANDSNCSCVMRTRNAHTLGP